MKRILFIFSFLFLALVVTVTAANLLQIDTGSVSNGRSLRDILNALTRTLDENTALSTELRTDSTTNRTAIVNLKNSAGELADDAATNRTALVNLKATAGEAADDIGTARTALINLKNTAGEAADDMGSMRTSMLAVQALGTTGDFLLGPTALAQGSNLTCVSNIAFGYVINGTTYYKAAVTTGTALTAATIHQNAYGGWRLIINASGTISVQVATANATGGYSNINAAAAGLPAITADTASMGTVYVTDSNSVFVAGTDNLNASGVTATYYNGNSGWYYLGQTTAPAAAMTYTSGTLTSPAATMTYGSGTLTNPAAAMTYTSGTLTSPAAVVSSSAPTTRVQHGR